MEPKEAKYRLEDLDIREVSFVPKAANKRKFLLYKADEGAEPADVSKDGLTLKDGPTSGDVHVGVPLSSDDKKKKRKVKPDKDTAGAPAVPKEDVAMNEEILKALEADLEGTDKIAATLKEADVSKKGAAAIGAVLRILRTFKDELPDEVAQQVPVLAGWPAPEPIVKEVVVDRDDGEKDTKTAALEAASPEVKAELEKLWKAQEEATEKQAELEVALKVEKDAKELATYVRKAETDYHMLPGKAEDLGRVLQMIARSTTNGDAEVIEKIFKAANVAIAKLAEEKGGGGGPEETDVMTDLDAKAAEMVKKGEAKSAPQAITILLDRNPELYIAYTNQA